jgi:DNA repair protein RadA/Sms
MAKPRQAFICRACGAVQSRWLGKCPDCGAWDSLESQTIDAAASRDPQKGLVQAWATPLGTVDGDPAGLGPAPTARPLADAGDEPQLQTRVPTRIGELDRVLGGHPLPGLVPGSVVLVGGPPGIGKSTLMLQAAGSLAAGGSRVLYVSSEESSQQVRMRAERLGLLVERGAGSDNLFILADTNLARIFEQARKVKPAVLVLDSVQMVYKSDLPASPGSVAQLRRCCAELVFLAKASGMAVLLVGHVTKEGHLAGPRLLEHLVDAVLYFEGDRYHAHRLIRGVKNRFGNTLELGIFEMTGTGLREVPEGAGVNASAAGAKPRPGSVVCPVMTGARCVLVELQALTATGFLGAAKRKSSGIDPSRLAMLIAVLEQHAELRLADRDIFASSVGGIRVAEPAADLAVLLAIAGAHYRRALPPATAAVGEVGLGGEVRPIGQLDQRVHEAARLGYRAILVPAGNADAKSIKASGIELIKVPTIDAAISHLS